MSNPIQSTLLVLYLAPKTYAKLAPKFLYRQLNFLMEEKSWIILAGKFEEMERFADIFPVKKVYWSYLWMHISLCLGQKYINKYNKKMNSNSLLLLAAATIIICYYYKIFLCVIVIRVYIYYICIYCIAYIVLYILYLYIYILYRERNCFFILSIQKKT